ncbi:hypothetical protein FACS1894126_2140 [Alphaproteobacteria bacterium]|nr:hypothetical protein FACS1894126_2140 [Alphaproteobacteria bacterium]
MKNLIYGACVMVLLSVTTLDATHRNEATSTSLDKGWLTQIVLAAERAITPEFRARLVNAALENGLFIRPAYLVAAFFLKLNPESDHQMKLSDLVAHITTLRLNPSDAIVGEIMQMDPKAVNLLLSSRSVRVSSDYVDLPIQTFREAAEHALELNPDARNILATLVDKDCPTPADLLAAFYQKAPWDLKHRPMPELLSKLVSPTHRELVETTILTYLGR